MQFDCKKMSQYFPKPYEPFTGDIHVKVDLSDYATKSDLKNATGIDIDKLKSVPTNLNILKNKVDKLDVGKLETTPFNLSKLKNVVKK